MSSHGEEIFSTSAQPAMVIKVLVYFQLKANLHLNCFRYCRVQIERENPLMGETFDAALCWVENPSLFWVTKIPPQHSIIWTEK